jgi:hypothetical protein
MILDTAAAAVHDVDKEDCTSQSRRLKGYSCYIQLFNLDLQPCFVELSSGQPSWLVESEEVLLRQVKHLTHYVDTTSSAAGHTHLCSKSTVDLTDEELALVVPRLALFV